MCSAGSRVEVQLDGGEAVEAARNQQLRGEGQLARAQYSDTVAPQKQAVDGGSLAGRMMHLWQLQLSRPPVSIVTVTATDVYGRAFTGTLTFQVAG